MRKLSIGSPSIQLVEVSVNVVTRKVNIYLCLFTRVALQVWRWSIVVTLDLYHRSRVPFLRHRHRSPDPFTVMNPYSASNFYQTYQQQNTASSDVNPYYQPYTGPQYSIPGSSSSHHQAPVPANAYEYDVGIVAQQSVYVPGAMVDKRGGSGGKVAKGGKRTTVLRKGAGKVWEDQTLLEWEPCE